MTPFYFTILLLCTISFGCIMGAYFGTVEYRIRSGDPLITSQCFCPTCRHTLTTWQQIPILGWFLLKGKCRYCGVPIPIRYPLAESAFLLYYGATFCCLWRHPLLMSLSWLGLIIILLGIRGRRHFPALCRGILLFIGYHILYGTLLLIILSAI